MIELKCPICGGIDVGKINKKVYFCWHCLLEIQMVEQNAQVYSINEDGGLQWYKKISCTKPGVDSDIAI